MYKPNIRLFSVLLFYVFTITNVFSQNVFFDWVNTAGGSGEELVSDITIDANGNIYAVGIFNGTVVFDSNSTTSSLTSSGASDIFVSKTNKYGTLLWVKKIGGNGIDLASSIALDTSGNLVITGVFQGSCDFNPSTTATSIRSSINGTADIFVCKLSSNGDFGWAVNIDGDEIPDIAIDSDNNILTTGTFSTTVDFDPGSGVFNIPATDETIFIWKISASGSFLWANEIDGNASEDKGYGIAVDSKNDVYVTGSFELVVDCDLAGTSYFLYSNGGLDILIAKYNSSGSFMWATSIGEISSDAGFDIETDSKDNVYITGTFNNSVDFNTSSSSTNNLVPKGVQDVFLLKLDYTGNYKWVRGLGSTNADFTRGISVDSEDGIALCGYFKDTLEMEAPNDTIVLYSSGSNDVFFTRYDSIGNLSWARSVGGSDDDKGLSIAMQFPSNQVVIAGSFNSTSMDFNPDTLSTFASSNGGADAFITRFYRCYKDSVVTIIGCDSVVGPSGNKIWYETGTYLDSVFSGCGGYAYVVNAIIPIDTANTKSITACVGYNSPSGKYYWTQSGIYRDTMFNGSYCGKDSINTIYLTIDTIPTKTYYISECHKVVSPSKKYTWYKSGIYLDTIPAPNSLCDSILTINVTILESYDTLNIEICEQYISPSGRYVFTTPGVYYDTLVNRFSCDSFITIYLNKVFKKTFSSQSVSACNEYVSPSGKYKWITNTIANDTILNYYGCDSIITFNVTFDKSYSSANIQGCVPYVSPSGKQVWTSSGKQIDTITNYKGCDSIMVITFTALSRTNAQLIKEGCNSFLSPSGIYTWTESGTYTDTISNFAGCDSVIAIDLTIVKTVKTLTRSNDTLIMPVSGLKYQWLNCDKAYKKIIGATKNYLVPTDDAYYAVEIKNSSCIDTSDCLTASRIGVIELTTKRAVIFPNPTQGLVHIKLAGDFSNLRYTVSSLDGRLISEEQIGKSSEFDVHIVGNSGQYIIALYADNQLIERAVIVKN